MIITSSIVGDLAYAFTALNSISMRKIAMNKREKSYGDMVLEFHKSEIDRTHYIGKPFIYKNTKMKSKSITVYFKSRKSRMAFYKTSPKVMMKERSQE